MGDKMSYYIMLLEHQIFVYNKLRRILGLLNKLIAQYNKKGVACPQYCTKLSQCFSLMNKTRAKIVRIKKEIDTFPILLQEQAI